MAQDNQFGFYRDVQLNNGALVVTGITGGGGSGTSCTSGTSGSNGTSGTSGAAGPTGPTGPAGTSGTSGTSGGGGTMKYGSFSGPNTLLSSVPQQLTIDTTGLTTNMYLNGSNGIVVPTAGIYTIFVFNKWELTTGVNMSRRSNHIYVNGSEVVVFTMGGTANYTSPQISFEYLISLSANDVVSIYCGRSGGETAYANTYVIIKQIA